MPLVFGMASSHAPSLFAETYDGWQRCWQRFSGGNPQPPEVANEGPEVSRGLRRADRRRVRDAAPRVGRVREAGRADRGRRRSARVVRRRHVPNLMIYAGADDIVGFHNFGADDDEPRLVPWEHPERFGVRLRVDRALADRLLDRARRGGLRRRDQPETFRRTTIRAARSRTRSSGRSRCILPRLDLPIVPIMMKTVERSPAILTGDRCLALGRAIEAICRDVAAARRDLRQRRDVARSARTALRLGRRTTRPLGARSTRRRYARPARRALLVPFRRDRVGNRRDCAPGCRSRPRWTPSSRGSGRRSSTTSQPGSRPAAAVGSPGRRRRTVVQQRERDRTMMARRFLARSLFLRRASAAAALPAAGLATRRSGAAQTPGKVRVAAIPLDVGALSYYAGDMGFFQKHGLDAEVTTGRAGLRSVRPSPAARSTSGTATRPSSPRRTSTDYRSC